MTREWSRTAAEFEDDYTDADTMNPVLEEIDPPCCPNCDKENDGTLCRECSELPEDELTIGYLMDIGKLPKDYLIRGMK